MRLKNKQFIGKIESWIWKEIVEHAIQSLGYEIHFDFVNVNSYRNQKGVPLYLAAYVYVPDFHAGIGDRNDMEQIKQRGNLESAIADLTRLDALEDFSSDQKHFGKAVNDQVVETGRYVLYRRLSRNPIIATMELKELHEKYKSFRNKYLLQEKQG